MHCGVSGRVRRVAWLKLAGGFLSFGFLRLFGLASWTLASMFVTASPAGAATASHWLIVSDLHYSPFSHDREPSPWGKDTNDALLTSFLAEARAVDPNPPVVVIAGDFLAHHFPLGAAPSTMTALARRFDATFPHAQFVIALGNNDSACGDYVAPIDGPFLAAAAKAWAPLVDRGGAAPDFATRFAHDGGYVARLPVAGLRIVVLSDVFDSIRYGAACANAQDGSALSLRRFRNDLRTAGSGRRNWVLMHVPPGIDAYTTAQLTHHLGIVPFLEPGAREAIEGDITNPADRTVLAIAGHTHKFGFRIFGDPGGSRVPMLLVPSLSPVFYNGPSFLEVSVAGDGSLTAVAEHSYVDGSWQRLGDLGTLGMRGFTAADLEALQRRLGRDPKLRATFARLYEGGGPPEINERNWRSYWCAAVNFSATAYDACTGQGGLSVFTGRALRLGFAAAALVVGLLVAFFFFVRRRAQTAKP